MVRYYDHALRQMARRRISREDVELVLRDHQIFYPSHVEGRDCYAREIDGRRIAVVVEAADHDCVVTAFDQLEGE